MPVNIIALNMCTIRNLYRVRLYE